MTNVVLLTVDALRRDHVGRYGYGRDTTPFLDAFGAEGVTVRGAVSVSSHTREAVPGLLAGRYPDAATDGGYRLATETLADRLVARGYRAGGFHSNPYLSRAFGYGTGFDAFDDDLYLGDSKLLALGQRLLDKLRGRHYAPAESINQRSLGWLDGGDGPFFLWNHYMDPHGPYDPPEGFDRFVDAGSPEHDPAALYRKAAVRAPGAVTAEEQRSLIDGYDGEVAYVDDCLGRFVDALDERGLLEDSLVVVTADHGDAFGEHGYYGHPRHMDDELVDVPMLLGGGAVEGGEVEGVASTLDVVATALSAVGAPPGDLPGRDLLADPGDDRVVFSQARGEGDEAHLRRFRATSGAGSRRVDYDLDAGTVTDARGSDDGRLAAALDAHVEARMPGYREGGRDGDAAATVEERLAALGYRE